MDQTRRGQSTVHITMKSRMRLAITCLLAAFASAVEYNLVASSPYRMIASTKTHLSLDSLELLQQATLDALVKAQDPTLYQTGKTNVVFQTVQQHQQQGDDPSANKTVVIRFFCVTSSAIEIQPVTFWDSLVNHILVTTMEFDSFLSPAQRVSTTIDDITIVPIYESNISTAGETNGSASASGSNFPLTLLDVLLITIVAIGFLALTVYVVILFIRDRREAMEDHKNHQESVNSTVLDTSNEESRDDIVVMDLEHAETVEEARGDVRIHVVDGLEDDRNDPMSAGTLTDDDECSRQSVETSLSNVVYMVQTMLRKKPDYRESVAVPIPDDESIPFDESRNGDDSLFQFDGSLSSDSFALVASSGHSTVCSSTASKV